MKLIGVTGKGGSGKTAFSKYLESKDTVGVIHVDSIVGNVKKRRLGIFLQPRINNTTESTMENPKVRNGIRSIIYGNRLAFNISISARNKMIENELARQIDEHKRNGKKVVIIDDWALPTNKKLLKKMNHVYWVNRGFVERRNAAKQRDNASTQELKLTDLPYALGFVKAKKSSNHSQISNFGTIQDLHQIADAEYMQIGELSFDERYWVTKKLPMTSVTTSSGKGKSSMKSTKDMADKQER